MSHTTDLGAFAFNRGICPAGSMERFVLSSKMDDRIGWK
jgi:hypothetical protein